jgi:predicted short-subunit dehydrogenase-like oxidoreductase (DUF2520 family)
VARPSNPERPAARKRAFVVGAGRIAAALVPGLRAAGWTVTAHARSAAGRAALRRLRVPSRALARAAEADLVLLAVPDADVAGAAAAVAPFVRRGAVVAHLSGALDLAPLAPVRARRAGVHLGSLHPNQALAGGPFLPGVVAAVDGDAAALRLLGRVARELGLVAIRVPPEGRVLYHAAAVYSSNLVMALADLAAETWAASGAPPELAVRAIVPLLRSAVENLERRGLPAALTGPASRGDAAVVARQMEALRGEAREAYALLTRRAVAIARRGGLPRAKARAVLRALAVTPASTRRAPRSSARR